MATDWVANSWQNSGRFSVNWRTFGLISLVMTGLVLSFLWIIAQLNEQRFETKRQSAHLQYQTQLEKMIETSSEAMIQLSSAVSFNKGLMEAVLEGDRDVYASELEALDWNLQTDSGMTLIGLYNLKWNNIFTFGELGHESIAEQVVENEQPHWKIDCAGVCRILTYTALLHEGDVVGVLVLAEPLSHVMLRFQRVANIDTGLLGTVNNESDTLIPSWQRSVMALTNPEQSKRVIKEASKDYSLEDLRKGVGLISVNDTLYELKAMPFQDRQMVVISNVSEDYSKLSQSKDQTIQISAAALVLGEVLLLAFLWRPLKRIKMSEQMEGFLAKQTHLLKEKTLALSKAQSLSQNLCDSVSAAVLILGEKGEIKRANQYFIKLLEKPFHQIEGRSIGELISSQSSQTLRRLADIYEGAIEEYEHVGRVVSASNQTHKMVWRYVPSYSWDDDGGERAERTIVAIGMPLMLPTLEVEQQWLVSRDAQTGMLNRQSLYDVIGASAGGLNDNAMPAQKESTLIMFRFGSAVFETTQTEQAYTRFLSALNAAKDAIVPDVSDIQIARLDKNEIAIVCQSDAGQKEAALSTQFLTNIQHLAQDMGVDLGALQVSMINIPSANRYPHLLVQRAQQHFKS